MLDLEAIQNEKQAGNFEHTRSLLAGRRYVVLGQSCTLRHAVRYLCLVGGLEALNVTKKAPA